MSGCILAGLRADGAPTIYGLPVIVNYSGSVPFETVNQTSTFLAMQQDFIALDPYSDPLFDVSFGENQLTITALSNFSYTGGYLSFNWDFELTPYAGLSFDGANLISSSLFSLPPFSYNEVPGVSFDPTTDSISISMFISCGPVGTGTVNNGGVAVISFTTVPEPSTWALLVLGTGAAFLSGRRARQ